MIRAFFRMIDRRCRPLSVRLTLWHSTLFFFSALALLGFTYALLNNRAYTNERDVIELRLKLYASVYQNAGLDGVRSLAAIRKGRAQKAFFVRIGDAHNRTIFHRDAEDWAEFQPERLSGQPLPVPDERTWQTLRSPQGNELTVASERLPGGGVLQVGKSTEDLNEVLGEYRRSALIVLLIFLPTSFVGGAFLASRVLRPVQHLTSAAQEIVATGRFDARVPAPGSGDELDALVRVFNEMLGRIDVLVRGMRDSIDNVAHDLRTPLTRLRARAQSVLSAETAPAPAHVECPRCEPALEALAGCVEDAERVATMLNTLMEIAEAEAGLAGLKRIPTSLAALIADTVDAYAELAEERAVRVHANIPLALTVSADPTALSRVFANLLDNAIKYTPPGGSVSIAGARVGNFFEVRVADTGIGIPAEDLPRIWERLFRSDRSRSERGLGLGLSFVRAIVEAHNGSATIANGPNGGTIVSVLLPTH